MSEPLHVCALLRFALLRWAERITPTLVSSLAGTIQELQRSVSSCAAFGVFIARNGHPAPTVSACNPSSGQRHQSG